MADQVLDCENTISMKEMANVLAKKSINIGRTKLFNFLKDRKVLTWDGTPYQSYINREWFTVIEVVRDFRTFPTTRVTPKGQLGIVKLIKKYYI